MLKNLISTRDVNQKEISYPGAILQGLAPDGGLYVPINYPELTIDELSNLKGASYLDLTFYIKQKFVQGSISDLDLKRLIQNAYSPNKFNFLNDNITPLRSIGEDLYLQNLSLGPTAAFKDMALQQLAQEVNHELEKRGDCLTILGATSGDTGSAAEAAFKGLDRVKLFMLSPKEGMSDFQKAQMGVLTGNNIYNISVNDGARFDDCQGLVKLLKQDPEFSKLGAVNSINWGRISSQVPYFISGYLQAVEEVGQEVDFVVPTGNFGNILSGYIAKKMGVPIRRLIAATNENDVVAKLIRTGVYELNPAQITSSPSMDISQASNYERLLFDLLGRDPQLVTKYMREFSQEKRVDLRDFGLSEDVFYQNGIFEGVSSHEDRINTIRDLYAREKTIIDPHTANALKVAYSYKNDDGVSMIVLETALPVKFEPMIEQALGFTPKRENRFIDLENRVIGDFYTMEPNPQTLKEYIRSNGFQ